MKRWLVLSIAISTMGCGHAEARRRETLASLRAGIEWVRGGAIDRARSLDREPLLDELIGAPLDDVRTALGPGRRCGGTEEPGCRSEDEIVYRFYRAPDPTEAAGPVLVLGLDDQGRIARASWRRVELELEEPGSPETASVAPGDPRFSAR